VKYSYSFSGPATHDIESALDYVEYALLNRPAAKALAQTVREEIGIILDNPELYAVIYEPVLKSNGIRFAMVKNYMLFYRFSKENKAVTIYRFLHGSRNWMSILRQSFTIE
jgi:plasmid stabilization system protein ParE